MICSIENNANGRKSELREELLTVLKNEASATMAYARTTGTDFKEKFGDWEDAFKNPDKGIETGNVSPTGEPVLYHKKGTNQHYYVLKDKTKEFIDKEGLRASFSTKNITDINSYLLHQYTTTGKLKSLNEFEDTQSNSKNIAEVIQKAIDDYKIEMDTLEDPDVREEFLNKIALIESYRAEFREELIYSIQSLGEKIREVAEEDKGGGVNITESTTVNPKTSASINTKIFLSQILDMQLSETPNDINIYPFNDGSYDIENLEGEVIGQAPNKEEAIALGFQLSETKEPGYDSKKSEYLNTEAFLPLDNVIKVLWPMLSDMVTTGSAQDVSSAYQKMYAKINEMKAVYPWMEGLMEKLDHLEKNDRNKLFEFVQTFSKTKINYYVTEFSAADNTYKVMNATSTNSKESIILDKWGYSFDKKFLGEQSHMGTDSQEKVKTILDNILVIQKEYNATLKLAGSDRVELSKVYTESSVALTKEMKALGIFDVDPRDFNNLILLAGGTENAEQTFDQLFAGFEFLRKGALANGKSFKENGDSINPFRSESVFRDFAKAASVRDVDTSDANVLANDNKNYFVYSNPSYVSNKISEWIADPSELIEMSNDPYNKNSRWAKWLLGTEMNRTEKERKAKSLARMEKFKAGLASSFKSKQKNDGVDNTKISFEDQLNDNITKMLGAKIKGGKSYFPTIVAADKSSRIEFEGLPMFNAGISGSLDDVKIHEKSINLLLGYFTDEYNRMMKVKRENAELNDDQKVVHYHGADGNGKKSQLFPEFNHDSTDPDFLELREHLYDSNGEPHSKDDAVGGLSAPQLEVLKKAIRKSLEARILETHKQLSGMSGLNSSLVKAYGNPISMAGDYLMNGIISNVEYTKMFSGDPAYYKSMPDLIKRVPATYSDGLQLALHSEDQLRFNMATVTGVEVASKYQKKIYDSLKDKSIAKAYGKYKDGSGSNVNTTDAQAWITPRRWRFLKQRLGQWSPKHDVVFSNMMSGKELRPDQLKLAAQPMKGVYFERNNNIPTYLKYSQAVLIPDLVKGTPMEKLYDKMTSDADGNRYGDKDAHKEIHEVVTIDGVKVGAIAPTSINKEGTTEMLEDFELNKVELSNKGWKLQQDLPVKTMHETNLGSQIQKTILESLGLKEDYLVDGKKVKGAALLQRIHDSISALSNIGREEVSKKLGIVGDKITDKSALYEVLIAEFKDRGGNENIIAALEKEFAFDAIPQIRGRVDSILMSIFNKAITKISTEGGSYIQVSPFGLETILDESKPTPNKFVSQVNDKIDKDSYSIDLKHKGRNYSMIISRDGEIVDASYHDSNRFKDIDVKPSVFNFTKEDIADIFSEIEKPASKDNLPEMNRFKKADIETLFEENPSLAKIGSDKEYNAYLLSIFPESKTTYFAYHGTNNKFDNFDEKRQNDNTDKNFTSEGFWFAQTKDEASGYGSNVKTVILNQKNPYVKQVSYGKNNERVFADQTDNIAKARENGNDSAILDINEGGLEGESPVTELVVFNDNQVHELGTKKDINGFKNFVEKRKSKSGIKIVSEDYNGKGLLPPRRGLDGQTLPGQAMIPHSLAMKILNESGINPKDITDWKGVFTPKALEIISYRIPNQGMSSNDTLQIVGILPAGMGDSIIGYDGIPAKTGSDFDIDKMFVMAPHLVYNTDTEKIDVLTMENSLYLDKDREKDLGMDENGEAIEPEFNQDSADKVKKQLAQNKVIELYNAVLQSPHTYDNMMTSIDANYLKDDIVGLFPKPAEQNLTFFSPINQLRTKMDYMSGKAGVGMTANQLVDHVSNQSLDIYLNTNLGFAGKGKTTSMDNPKKGKSIATSLSAFLNAYVDIAKDPYISRGNHNEVTANVGFMLIRAGMDTKMLNRFIGQPILREYVELVRRKDSITGAPLMHEGRLMEPAEYLMAKKGIKKDVAATAKAGKLTQAELEASIKDPSLIDNNGTILNAFIKLEADGKKFAEAVSAAKSDTKGSGGSPIDMVIAKNKIKSVKDGRFVMGYESKFKDTALGTYEENSLNWVSKVLNNSQILLSGSAQYENTLNRVSVALGKGPYMTSAALAKDVDGAIYAYLMADTELFKNNRTDFKKLFLTLPQTIGQMKIDKSENFLVKELEIQRRGGYAFIGINNKNKPVDYQNNIYRAWMELYRDPATKELAMDLAKYSYTQSGFQPNLNQFFTYMPHEILKDSGFNSDVIKMYDKLQVVANSDDFIDQFSRHNSGNPQIVPSISLTFVSPADEVSAASGFKGEPMSDADTDNGKLHPLFVTRGAIGDPMLFKAITQGEGSIPALDKDGAPMYIRTFKLGYKAGKNKIFEYSYENKLKSSVVPSNNLGNNPYLKKQINEKYTTFKAEIGTGLDIDFHAGLEDHLNKYASENISDEESAAKTIGLSPEQIAEIIRKKNIKEKGCE